MDRNQDIINIVKTNQRKFQKYNELKLGNLKQALSDQQVTNLLEFIPYLLNVNIPNLFF